MFKDAQLFLSHPKLGNGFIVFNPYDFVMNNDEIVDEDLSNYEYEDNDFMNQLKSCIWSSNIAWGIILKKDGMYLFNSKDNIMWHCKKHSVKFAEMLLEVREFPV